MIKLFAYFFNSQLNLENRKIIRKKNQDGKEIHLKDPL